MVFDRGKAVFFAQEAIFLFQFLWVFIRKFSFQKSRLAKYQRLNLHWVIFMLCEDILRQRFGQQFKWQCIGLKAEICRQELVKSFFPIAPIGIERFDNGFGAFFQSFNQYTGEPTLSR